MIAVSQYTSNSYDTQQPLVFNGMSISLIALVSGILIASLIIWAIRKYYYTELEVALIDLQKANNAKSEFLAKMSHEMRTPLNAVIGLSELTLDAGSLCENDNANLEKIYNAGISLLNTVNDILDISKIEAGKLEIIPTEYELPSLLNDSITQSMTHIGEKPIKFVLSIAENLPLHLIGDELRVKQIINNLLSNSFKYTQEGTVELSISCVHEGETAWLKICSRDTGIGIRPEDINSLFDEYVKMDLIKNRGVAGTGLGLPITKKLAEMMDGSVAVASQYGKGSLFTVIIRQQYVDDAIISSETIKNLKNFNYYYTRRKAGNQLSRVKLPYARILVVDDNVINFDVAKGMLKPYGMQIDCVTDGQQAIDVIREGSVIYDAIFMDHMMPGMDGIEATRIIREEIGTQYARNVPIIALTANAVKGSEEKFLKHGFQSFISKPIEIKSLDCVVNKWVRSEEKEKALGLLQPSAENRFLTDRRCGADRRANNDKDNRLNMNGGINRFSGDEEAFIQVLSSFAANIGHILETIRSVNKETLPEYAITVHGIKASCRGICANNAGDRAEALEKAAKAGDYIFVSMHNAAFVETVEELRKDIQELLNSNNLNKPKPVKDMPDSQVLFDLITACKNYDMDGADAAMAQIDTYDYEYGSSLAAWLRKNVSQMNFEQIIEKLSSLPLLKK